MIWIIHVLHGGEWRWIPSAPPDAECSKCSHIQRGGGPKAIEAWNRRAAYVAKQLGL